MSWALLAVGAWAVLVRTQRDGWRAALRTAAACGLAVAAVDGALAGLWGYDPIGTLRATEAVYRASLATSRPYAFWAFGSPVAWGVMLGLPLAAAGLRGLRAGDAAARALAAVLVIAAVGGFTKAETERIWLMFVPRASVAAAPHVRPRRLTLIVALLLAQGLAVELLMDTVW
jgi:hypothetical protein